MYVQTREELEQPSRVRQFVAEVVAAEPRPERFKGFLELKDVLLDVQIDDVRCILLKTTPVRAPNPGLSPRELEIARMVAKGLPNKSIAPYVP